MKTYLDGLWKLSFTMPDSDEIINTDINVPCNIEPKLQELGLLGEYLPPDRLDSTSKFDGVDDWTYITTFDAPEKPKGWGQQLVFEGIDTIAEVYLNDELVCDCMNMHIAYNIDVTDKLKEKDNELKVVIRSASLWARDVYTDEMAMCNHKFGEESVFLRKARHQWGWDNAPRVITSGIINSVYIENINPVRIENVYVVTQDVNEDSIIGTISWEYITPKKYFLGTGARFTVTDGERAVYTKTIELRQFRGRMEFVIPRSDIELWWPAGFGEAKLYDIKLEILENGEPSCEYARKFGFRTLKLDMGEYVEENGDGRFVFVVNGENVYIRGTNWKPVHYLASQCKDRVIPALEEAKNLHCNMIRIWGGGIYEGPEFFDYCDRNGIMVWQDFMLACEIPYEADWYCELIAEEAEYIIKRQRNHPSLAVWCGDNENDQVLQWYRNHSSLKPSDMYLSRNILKDAVLHYDPFRSYVPSSPYVSDITDMERQQGKIIHNQLEQHFYAQSEVCAEELRRNKNIFIGETGPMALNAISDNPKMLEDEKKRARRLWDVEGKYEIDYHQTDVYFIEWRNSGKRLCQKCYDRDFAFDEWDDYKNAVNICCAEIYKDIIEFCRVNRWSKTGVIWWSLLDMWPMLFNYSVIDSEFGRKLPYYWIRQAQQDFAIVGTWTEEHSDIALYAANDTLREHRVSYTVTAYDKKGKGSVIATGSCRQEKNSSSLIQRIDNGDEAQLWIIRWTDEGKECVNHVFTGNADYETTKMWAEIIKKEYNI